MGEGELPAIDDAERHQAVVPAAWLAYSHRAIRFRDFLDLPPSGLRCGGDSGHADAWAGLCSTWVDNSAAMIPATGLEWIVDARGCPAAVLADLDAVRGCCERIVREMELHVVGSPQWRQFDGPGGVTGLYLLSESHLSVHTFPEYGLVCLNVYCCRPRNRPDWSGLLGDELGTSEVVVREVTRGLCDGTGTGDSSAMKVRASSGGASS